jgi:SAM-dependent methyltransferase
MLLNALCAMNLLNKKEGRYSALGPAKRFLNKNSDDYIGHMIMHHHHLASSWLCLDEAVITGKPVGKRTATSNDEPRREAFLMGMFTQARLQAVDIVKLIDIKGRKHLLDLGGGPGTYAIYFCMHNPDLTAVVFDLKTTQPFAQKTISRFSLSDRISFCPGDYHTDDIQGEYDVVWLSHILHAEGPRQSERLVKKAADVLKPGGLMLIHEFYLNDNKDGPLFPALFSLNMLRGTHGGQSYSESEVRAMMQAAGVSSIHREPYCGPTESGILSGVRT